MSTNYIVPPALTERTTLVGVLQQLQAAIALAEPEKNATLADVARFVEEAQHNFGADRDLEVVIQMLVAQDLTRQLHERRTPYRMIQEPLVLVGQES